MNRTVKESLVISGLTGDRNPIFKTMKPSLDPRLRGDDNKEEWDFKES